MGRTLTDFSQLSKGMFTKSDPVVEVKPLPPKKTAGDDALAYFGIGGTGNGEQGTAWGRSEGARAGVRGCAGGDGAVKHVRKCRAFSPWAEGRKCGYMGEIGLKMRCETHHSVSI